LSTDCPGSAAITLSELYETYAEGLRRYALYLARDSDLAEDLVSETLIRAMSHLQLLGQLNCYQRQAWLKRVLKNRFLDDLRTRRREQALLGKLACSESHFATKAPFFSFITQVPEQYRELLQMRYLLGMTSEEIGLKLGIPAATVRSRLHLAAKWLRAHQNDLDFIP